MFSIRKWIAAKMMSQVPPDMAIGASPAATSDSRNTIFHTNGSGSRRSHRSQQRRNNQQPTGCETSNSECGGTGWKAPFEMTASSLLKFYYADDQLNMITAELDSFDGRKDPVRCTNLVNQLR